MSASTAVTPAPTVETLLRQSLDSAAEMRIARRALAMTSGWAGASQSDRALRNFMPGLMSADDDSIYDIATLRARTRDLEKNDALAGGVLKTYATSVIGPGLKLQSHIDAAVLGLSDNDAEAMQTLIEDEFEMFCRSCDIEGNSIFAEMQNTAYRNVLSAGDIIALLPQVSDSRTPYKTKIQLVEADRLSNPNYAPDSATAVQGVEKDQYGRPVRYHICNQYPVSISSMSIKREWKAYEAFGAKSGRRNVIHLFRKMRPGQTRGIPLLAPVIKYFKQLSKYTDAELMAAVIQSYFTAFITRNNDWEPENAEDKVMGELKLGVGAVMPLAKNESVEFANPSRPNTGFDAFILAILRQIGVALEIPFEILIKHFTSSYSASRAAMLEAWKVFYEHREWFTRSFCQIVFEVFMDEAVGTGRIWAPGYFKDHRIRAAYLHSKWVGPARGQIDEYKEVQAAMARINAGLSTRDVETAALSGMDWDDVVRQLAREQQKLEALGLALPVGTQPNASLLTGGV